MTIKMRFLSTIVACVVVVLAGVVAITASVKRNNMIEVHAHSSMKVAVAVGLTNAGREVEIENNQLSKINSRSAIALEDQVFHGAGLKNAICYTINATNNEHYNVTAHFNELNPDNLDNLDVIHEYTIIRGDQHIDTTNDVTLLPHDILVVKVSVYVVDSSQDADSDISLSLNVSRALCC